MRSCHLTKLYAAENELQKFQVTQYLKMLVFPFMFKGTLSYSQLYQFTVFSESRKWKLALNKSQSQFLIKLILNIRKAGHSLIKKALSNEVRGVISLFALIIIIPLFGAVSLGVISLANLKIIS